MLISNSLLISSANLAIRELDEPPKTISSTYTCTIRISLPEVVFALMLPPPQQQLLLDLDLSS
jgi:hypothetical protein